jgi:DNA-binding LacI/PurR family transcriptional regulator
MNNEYEWAIWRGVARAVEERGGSVVSFAGASIGDPRPDHHARSILFELLDASRFDGILCLSSVVGHYAGVAATEDWLEHWGLPVSSIGPAELLPTVVIDDGAGVRQLMHHLIEHHDYKRIAFIQGALPNSEAQRRHEAYLAALAEHGLPLDPRLVLAGNFTTESGTRAIFELFDVRQVKATEVDAIVASNDYMACGAMEELARRRIDVPDQIAVVGFDDIGPARVYEPPLTTVRQPLELLGREGATRLLDRLAGKPLSGALTVQTELVLRRSCGCVPTDGVRRRPSDSDPVEAPKTGHAVSANTVLAALSAELQGGAGKFAAALEPLLREIVADGGGELDEGRRLADELATRVRLAREDLIHERLTRLARILHTRMFGPQVQLSTALAEFLPSFGIEECAVSEFVPGKDATMPAGRLKLAFGFDRRTVEPQITTFDARLLLPPSFDALSVRSSFVMPLTCGPQSLGVAVIPASSRDGKFYETLAELFATILKVLELRRGTARVA